MKLAILGHSPFALEAALRFHLHGAAFTWYCGSDDVTLFNSAAYSPDMYSTDLGRNVLKEIGLVYRPEKFSWDEWKKQYEAPLITYLKAQQEVRSDEVVSVTKRFLAPGEKIEGRSRFLDLFRVIYRIDPKDFIEEQKTSNPETYQRLTEEFVKSLASSIEMYQDYDLVLDFRNDLTPASLSVTGRALGEGRKTDKTLYGLDALRKAKEVKPSPETREIALIGSDSLSAEILLSLTDWIKDERSRLFIVSHEEEPFKKFLSVAHPATKEKFETLMINMEQEFQEEIKVFTKKLREWQEMDDFVQAKIPRPSEPIPRINFFSGHNVTAADELIDRNRMFLTLEKPDFRQGLKHPENNYLDLKTIGADLILVSHAKKDSASIHIDANEDGFFEITPSRPNIEGGWISDIKKLEGIEDEIFKLFSPVDSH